MKLRHLFGIVAMAVVAVTACEPETEGPPPPPGEPTDGGVIPQVPDAGPLPDAGPPPPRPPPDAGTEPSFRLPPVQTKLEQYELRIPQEAMDLFERDLYAPAQPAKFLFAGREHDVFVRLRGASSRTFPKKSWKVEFPSGVEFQGRDELNLVAEYQDCTMMAEKLAYDTLAAMGVPAPRTKYVRVVINGKYQGVFVDIEQVDKHFLEAHELADEDASIYRCGWKDCEMKTWKAPYQGEWEKRTNENDSWDDLDAFLAVVNHTSEPELVETLEKHLEVERYLRSMTMDVLMSNNYVEDSESFLIHDQVTGKWSYVPWDLNNVDARWWHTYGMGVADTPIVKHSLVNFTLGDLVINSTYANRLQYHYEGYVPVFTNLGTRIVLNPELRERLFKNLERAQKEFFNDEVLHPRIDAIYALVSANMIGEDNADPNLSMKDPYIDPAKLVAGRGYLQKYVTGRNAFIQKELARFRAKTHGLMLQAVDPRSQTVVLKNRGATAVNLAGLTLTNDLRKAMAKNLPDRTLAPGETASFNMAELGLPLSAKGEVGLFDGKTVMGVMDALFYGEAPSGKRHARAEDENGAWTFK
jgi:spore coat protein H